MTLLCGYKNNIQSGQSGIAGSPKRFISIGEAVPFFTSNNHDVIYQRNFNCPAQIDNGIFAKDAA